MDLNKVTLIGNMVYDPVSRKTAAGATETRFTLATTSEWDSTTKSKRVSVDFHDVVAFGKLGEIVQQYVKQGAKIYIEGRSRNRTTTRRAGTTRRDTEVVADNMIMLGQRPARGSKIEHDDRPLPVEPDTADVGGAGQ